LLNSLIFLPWNNETKELLDRKNIKNSPTCQQSEAYLESEQQDETRNVAECDSEKAEVTDAQETTANKQTIMFCLLL
jgi:hypothetical protein